MERFRVEHKPGGDQTEVTRQAVKTFFRSFVEGDLEAYHSVVSADMLHWSIGDFWWSGIKTDEEAQVVRNAWVGNLKDGGADFKVDVLSLLADGNRASVEIKITATWHDGTPYESLCAYGLDLIDGKLVMFREYFDTAYESRFRQPEPPTK